MNIGQTQNVTVLESTNRPQKIAAPVAAPKVTADADTLVKA